MSNAPSRIRGRRLQRRRAAILAAEPLCRRCRQRGFTVAAVQVDHVTPLHLGGSDTDPDNLQPLCLDCHDAKTAREMADLGRRRDWETCEHGLRIGEGAGEWACPVCSAPPC